MKRGQYSFSALALLAFAAVCSGVQLASHQSALEANGMSATVEAVDPLDLETCAAGDVPCEAGNLQTKADYAQSLVEKLTQPLTDAKTLLGKVTTAKNDIDGLKTTFLAIKIAVKIASKLPVVGSVFLAIETIVKAIATGIENLASSLKSVHTALIKPWETALGTIETSFVDMPDTLFSIIQGVAGAAGVLPQMCLKDTLSTLLPSVEPALTSVSGAVGTLTAKIDALIENLDATWTAVSTGGWSQAKATLSNLVDKLDVVGKVAVTLSPITSALDTRITIPWLGEVRNRDLRGKDSCPPGMQPKDLFCHSGCGPGMDFVGLDAAISGNAYKCMSKCDTGTFESDGVRLCKNPGALTAAGLPYSTPICKGCNDGDSLNGLGPCDPFKTCTPACKDGKVSLGNGYCTTACTTGGDAKYIGFPPSLGVNVCTVKVVNYVGLLLPTQCRPGYTWDMGYCRENCRPGEAATWDFCFSKAEKSFTIKEVMNEINKVLSSLEKLPLYREIMDAVGRLVQSALGEVTKAIRGLNLPTTDNLPSIAVDFASIDALPVGSLKTAITDILNFPAGVNLDNIAKVPAELEKMMSSFISKARLPTNWANCRDIQCFTSAMGVPPEINFDKIKQTLTSLESVFEEILIAGLNQGLACAESKTVSVPLTTTIASVLGLSSSQVKPCDLSMTVCTKPVIDEQALNDALAQRIFEFQPLLNLLTSMGTAGQQATLLQQGTNLRHRGEEQIFLENQWIPVFIFPSLPLMSHLDLSNGRWPSVKSILFRSQPGAPTGTFVRISPVVNIFLYLKFVNENGKVGMQMSGTTYTSFKVVLWKGTRARETMMHVLQTVDEELAGLNTQQNKCLQSVYPATKGEGPATHRTAYVYNIGETSRLCKKLKKRTNELQDINNWKQKTIGGKPVDEAALIADTHAFWDRADVKSDVSKLADELYLKLKSFVLSRKDAMYGVDGGLRQPLSKASEISIPLSIGFEGGVPVLLTTRTKGWVVGPVIASPKHQLDFSATFSTDTGSLNRVTLWIPSVHSFRRKVADNGWFSGIFDKRNERYGFGFQVAYAQNFFDSQLHTLPTKSPTQSPTVATTASPTKNPTPSPSPAPVTSPPTLPGLHIVSGSKRVESLQPKDYISCETQLYISQSPSTYALVLRVGDTWETRVPSVYLTPWSAKIQMRTSTLEHWNYAVTGPALSLRTRYMVKVYVWGRYHIITLDGKIVTFELVRKGLVQVPAPHGLFEGSPELQGQMSTPVCDLQPMRPLVNKVLQNNLDLGPNVRCVGSLKVNTPPTDFIPVFRMQNRWGGFPFIIWATSNEIMLKMGNPTRPWGLYACKASINFSLGATISLSIRGKEVWLEEFGRTLCKTTLPELPYGMYGVTIFEGFPQNPPINMMTRDFVCLPQ